MLFTTILLAVCCAIAAAVAIHLTTKNRQITEKLQAMSTHHRKSVEEFENHIEELIDSFNRERSSLIRRLGESDRNYKNFKSHVHVIEADAPEKKTAMYASMKLSAFLEKYISYDDTKGTCNLLVLDLNAEK